MFPACPHSRALRICALVAFVFGVLTVIAGGRILLGLGEAGYVVVRPVLLFNTTMGVLYLATAILIVRGSEWARPLATVIAAANVAVLVGILAMRGSGGAVADRTVGAMTLRALVWVAIAVVLHREYRRRSAVPGQG